MNYYVKKTISFILTLLLVAVISFVLFQVIPGDSVVTKLGLDATEEQIAAVRAAEGLDKPAVIRFFDWISKVVTGDFGTSSQYGVSAGSLILERFEVTIGLGIVSLIIIIIVSIPLGILSSYKKDSAIDKVIKGASQLFMAIPSFFMGILITLLFGIVIKAFVPGGYKGLSAGFFKYLGFIIFPAISVALPKIAITVRFIRGAMRGEENKDYVRTVVAKGADRRKVTSQHIFRNSMMPIITFIGLLTAEIFAGSIMTEQVFNIPGMGRLLVTAIANRDFAVVSGIVIIIAVVVITVNFIVDILYRVLDPRI